MKSLEVKQYIPIGILICVGLGLSLVGFNIARSGETQHIEDKFQKEASASILTIKNGIDINLENLRSIKAFYMASKEVERQEFRSFVQPILSRHKNIQALEWIPRIPDEKRAAYQEAARADGHPDFQITEKKDGNMVKADQREEYFPVYYVEPFEGNKKAFGFDLASNETRKRSLIKARDTGRSVATARITLVQEKGSQSGFLLFNPIYHKNMSVSSVESRRKHLTGFALGVFRIGDMIEASLRNSKIADMDIYLFDDSSQPEPQMLHFRPARISDSKESQTRKNKKKTELTKGLHYAETFDVGGRRWTILCAPGARFGASLKTGGPWFVLIIGFLITAFIGAYLRYNVDRRAEVEKMVDERTRELFNVKKRIENDKNKLVEVNKVLEESKRKAEASLKDAESTTEMMLGREEKVMELNKEIERLKRKCDET